MIRLNDVELIFVFLAGVLVCAVALPLISRVRERMARRQRASDAQANQVTTVSQGLHLAVQGSPTALTVLDRNQEIILSNPAARDVRGPRSRRQSGNLEDSGAGL